LRLRLDEPEESEDGCVEFRIEDAWTKDRGMKGKRGWEGGKRKKD
jgi:hypothetical protein